MTSKNPGGLHRFIPAAIFAAGCAASLFAFHEVRQSNRHRTVSELDVRSELLTSEFHAKLLDFSVPVEAVSIAIAVNPDIDQAGFERLALQTDREDPVDALAWIPAQRIVADDNDARMLSHALDDDAGDTAWLSDQAFRTQPQIKAALRNASHDREPIAVPLPAFAPGSERALLILWPTFRGGSSAEARDFLGVAVGVYRYSELLARGLQGMPDTNERISVFVGAVDEAAVPAAFHVRSMNGAREGRQSLGAPSQNGLRVVHAFEAFSGTWRLVFDYPADVVGADALGTAWLDLALGILISTLLAWYVRKEQQRITVVETVVEARTRELRATSDQLRAMIEASPLPIGCIDGQLNVTLWNSEAENLFGYTAAEIIGKPYPVVSDDEMEAFLVRFAAVAGGQILRGAESRRRCKDGSIVEVLSFAAPFHDAQGALLGVVFCIQDMTEQNKLRRQLIQAQKMETIGQLAAGMAHEINTPIQYVADNVRFVGHCLEPVLGMAECAAEIAAAWRAGELSEAHIARCEASRGRVQFEYIRKNVPSAVEESLEGLRRVASIVAAMRDFSHPSGGKKAPADLGDVLRTAATVARNEWKRVAELTIDVDDDVPKVACLRDELGQVFLNLIVNAAHAIAAAQRNTQGSIRISARRDRDFVEVRVRDTGTGIPAEVRSRVFDPFFTTKAVGQGTGQGLAICYATVVEKHAGQIDFESELGVGTTFIVRLPIVDVTVAVV